MTAPIVDQPPPVANERPHIADLVCADIQERKRLGLERYGTALQPHNGRDALVDAYQEQLDHVKYLRQEIEERADHRAEGALVERGKIADYVDHCGFHALAQEIRDCAHHDTMSAPASDYMPDPVDGKPLYENDPACVLDEYDGGNTATEEP